MLDPLFIKMYQKNPSNEQLIEIVNIFYDLQRKNRFATIGTILDTVNLHRCEDVIILSLIRCNKLKHRKITKWDSFTNKVRTVFASDGREQLLVGLI